MPIGLTTVFPLPWEPVMCYYFTSWFFLSYNDVCLLVMSISVSWKLVHFHISQAQLITGSHGSGNTVVSPVGTVNGKPVTLDRWISETAEGNLTKFGTGNYVAAKFMCAKFQKNRAAGFSPAHTQHVHPPMAFVFLFFCLGSSNGVQPKPLNRFWRVIRQKNRFGSRRCLFHPKNGQKPPFKCISMGNKNANNFWTERLIFTKFGM